MATAPVTATALGAPEIFMLETPAATRTAKKAHRIEMMQAIANNEPDEGKKAVHEIFIAELKMLLEKEQIEESQDLQSFLAERVEYWVQSRANLPPDNEWKRIVYNHHIHELKTHHLQLLFDDFCGSDCDYDH